MSFNKGISLQRVRVMHSWAISVSHAALKTHMELFSLPWCKQDLNCKRISPVSLFLISALVIEQINCILPSDKVTHCV